MNGCYEALQSGKASEGLLDLTGGLTEVYYPPQINGPELFDVMRQALRNGAFVACNTVSSCNLFANETVENIVSACPFSLERAKENLSFTENRRRLVGKVIVPQDNEHDGSKGLITGHAYSVTMAKKIPTAEGTKDLLRIFNPWGATEWTGDWSDTYVILS